MFSKRSNSRSILPTFLNDRKHYTCAFQLPSEIEENDQEMLEDHQKRIQESSQEITEMVLLWLFLVSAQAEEQEQVLWGLQSSL
jgi:hypothetical protein